MALFGRQTDDGADVLTARVYGDDIPALKMAALDKARALYGPDAALRIDGVGEIETSLSPERHGGKYHARVRVRCLNLPDEDR